MRDPGPNVESESDSPLEGLKVRISFAMRRNQYIVAQENRKIFVKPLTGQKMSEVTQLKLLSRVYSRVTH